MVLYQIYAQRGRSAGTARKTPPQLCVVVHLRREWYVAPSVLPSAAKHPHFSRQAAPSAHIPSTQALDITSHNALNTHTVINAEITAAAISGILGHLFHEILTHLLGDGTGGGGLRGGGGCQGLA